MRFLFIFLLFGFFTASNAQIPSYVPTNGLVGWWPFNGNANDESGNGNNGTVNGATLTSDRYDINNSAFYFNSNYIRCINPGPLGKSNRTISMWVRSNSISLIGEYLVSYGSNNIGGGEFGIRLNRICNGIAADINLTAITNDFQNNSDNQWHHYAVVFDSILGFNIFNLLFYVDGVQIMTTCNSVNINSQKINTIDEEPITFGRWCDLVGYSSFSFNGSLDDIAIYNRALTQQEITQLYTRTITTSTPEDTTSNVGIGTINPKRKLHVNDVMRLEPRDTVPANPAKGDIYFDGELNKLRYYNGTGWISL